MYSEYLHSIPLALRMDFIWTSSNVYRRIITSIIFQIHTQVIWPLCSFFVHVQAALTIHGNVCVCAGERRTVVSCMRIANKTMEVVNNSYCQPENRPLPQVRLCNSHHCQYRWDTHAHINITIALLYLLFYFEHFGNLYLC